MTTPVSLTLSEQLLYSTVKIAGAKSGLAVGTGTGFIWKVQDVRGQLDLILTNKHVIEGCDTSHVAFHVGRGDGSGLPSGQVVNLNMTLDPRGLFYHPDPSVDLVAIGFSPFVDQAERNGTPLFYRTTGAELIPSAKDWAAFDVIEDVLMIGYPRGISDEVNNRPIARQGITATSLDVPYDGRDEFMVDMACFPGSSGSPVFMKQSSYVDRATNAVHVGAIRFFLLGVLYAGPLINQSGRIQLGVQPTVEVAAMMHLGQVIRSTRLLEIDDLIRTTLA